MAATPLPAFEAAGFSTELTAAGGWLYQATNAGTINATGSSLVLQAFTNNGTINGTGVFVDFTTTWANHGTIRADAASTLSLFAERAERGALPATPTTVLPGDALDVHATTGLGYRISAVATRDHRLFLVSEQPTDPPEAAQDILRATVRFIRTLEK